MIGDKGEGENNEHLVGKITGFTGSAGSGLGTIFIDGKPIMCENSTTVRALDDAFGNVITKDHSVNTSSIIGRTIVYSIGDYGLLEWFRPIDPEDLLVDPPLQTDQPSKKSSEMKCASCEKLLEGEEPFTGEFRTHYEGEPLCETCYYEADVDATVVQSDREEQIITSTRNETDGEFWVSWHSTDAWRGYYETHF